MYMQSSYPINKNLNSFIPHLYSVIKHCQDPDNYPIYYRYWKNILSEVLNQKDDYTLHWLSFWNDALRNDYTGTGYITGGRRNITYWLFNAIKSNKSYDQFVKELSHIKTQ